MEIPMQSITEVPITSYSYSHNTHPPLPNDNISPLGSGNIFTNIIIISNNPQPLVIKCIRHPLNDRDAGFLSGNWSRERLRKMRSVLLEVKECRTVYWAQQPDDHQRFGRREALAREHSVKVIDSVILDQEEREGERREGRMRRDRLCAVM